MSLSAAERQAVQSACRETLPAGTRVLLFGSRVDDSRRGGDIDLLVELPGPLSADDTVERRTRFTARLYRLLEERRIDVVVTQQGCPDERAVVAAARQQGIESSRLGAVRSAARDVARGGGGAPFGREGLRRAARSRVPAPRIDCSQCVHR